MLRRSILCLTILLGVAASACRQHSTPGLRAVWRWRPPPTASVGMPAVDRMSVAVTYGHLRLVLLDDRGAAAWESDRLGLRDVAPLLLGDRVVAATDTGVAAFDRRTGHRTWDVDLGDRANTPVAVANGRLAVTTWDGRLLVLDGASGTVEHSVTLPGPVLGPAAASGHVALASWDDGAQAGVVAVDALTGAARWRHAVDADGVSSPAVTGRVAVVVTGDAHAVGFALDSGHPVWTRTTSGAGSPEVPPFVGAQVIVADRLGGLLSLDRGTAHAQWRVPGRGAAVRGGPTAVGRLVALPVDVGRVLVRVAGRVTVLDPPGRVSGVAGGAGGLLVVATREADQNELVAYR
jgi:outer membrane protein assembly factor BamB